MSLRRSRSDMIAETRAKLIAVARKTFAAEGFASASMDDFTAEVGLTRGALYHHFGDKKGLLRAVIDEIDKEIDADLLKVTKNAPDLWEGFVLESQKYLEKMLDPEIQQIVMRDGPAVLGDVSTWQSHGRYTDIMAGTLQKLMAAGIVKTCDAPALARQINGALMHAAAWIANSPDPGETLPKAQEAFGILAESIKTA